MPAHFVKVGGGFIIEKYPDAFPWSAPENPDRARGMYRRARGTWGVCTCPACAHRTKHLLNWPNDAFYQTEIRGQTLWAWHRDQAVALRAFIASPDRKYTGLARQHFWFLRHLPKHFLEIKHKKEALKKLDRLLIKVA